MHLVIEGVVFLFFPTVGILASVFVFAALVISLNKILGLPVRTLVLLVFEGVRLPSEVLPVVSVNAVVSCVICITIRTPDSLEMEYVKISVLFEFIQQIDSDLFFRVSKSAHISIVAVLYFIRICLTKLDFVLFRMVEFLHSVVGF
jgi:hypothetical protein